MNLRTVLTIHLLEPQPGGLTLIDASAPNGTRVLIETRVVEPLAVGDALAFSLRAESTAQPTLSGTALRERMQARAREASSASAGTAPRLAMNVTAPASTAAPRSASVAAPPPSEASSLLLSTILGGRAAPTDTFDTPDNAPLVERNVDDELDALLGAPPRKG